MAFIPLLSGAYQSRSLIAAAQRCVNLYLEQTPSETGEPLPTAHLPTPGLTVLSVAPTPPIRGLYTSSAGDLFAVAARTLYYIDPNWTWHTLGQMIGSAPADSALTLTPVSMADSGISLLLVDGSLDGWTLDLPTRTNFQRIDSNSNTVTGTVANPALVGGMTIILDTTIVTLAATDTTVAAAVVNINNTAISNQSTSAPATLKAFQAANGALSIRDNSGTAIIIGPGTANTALGLTDGMAGVPDPGGFYGSVKADFTDTYFLCVKPKTALFYVSESESTNFDALDFAGKSGKADLLQTLIVSHRVIALMGTQSIELWYNSGGGGSGALSVNTFPFEAFPNTLIQHGVAAIYSVVQMDGIVYFLSQDTAGQGIVMVLIGQQAIRISTHAIEQAISKYSVISDALGTVHQMGGHQFYLLSFPTGDATWCYDATTKQWHERVWIDQNGEEHRHRCAYTTAAYGLVVGADWENGNLYHLDSANFTDAGTPIKRVRSFPHSIDMSGNRRIAYKQFIANMTVGEATSASTAQTVVQTSFTAADGTLLQNYVGPGDIGSAFTQIAGGVSGEIFADAFTGVSGGGAEYLASGIPLSPDYTVQFNAAPSSYATVATSIIYAIGRATPAYKGYQAAVTSDGTSYYAVLVVMPSTPTTIAMGSLTSGHYAVTLTMQSHAIEMRVQRSQDGCWLTSAGTWMGYQSTAIAIQDATYPLAGRIIIGGSW